MKYLSSVIAFILLISICYLAKCSADVGPIVENALRNEDWTKFAELVEVAEMKGFFTRIQTVIMVQEILMRAKQAIFTSENIGRTQENNDMTVYCITHEVNKEVESIPIVFITGAHHAREPLSVSMIVYTFLRIVIENNKGTPEYVDLLKNSKICTIPIVNIDGYLFIEKKFKETGSLLEIRKNRRQTNCSPLNQGVDLNRNYGFNWGKDNIGSSDEECKEDYRGPSAFSEPETKAIKGFIERNIKQIVLVINFHAYGNLWIYPYNCCPEMRKSSRISAIYQEFSAQKFFPNDAKIGNAMETINYLANGEATDWLLGEYGIIGMSPELGLNTATTNSFFPPKETIYISLEKDYAPIWFLLSKMNPDIRVVNITEIKIGVQTISFQFKNRGYSKVEHVDLRIDLFIEYNEDIAAKPEYPKLQFAQYNETTSELIDSFEKKIPRLEQKDNSSRFSLHTHVTLHSWTIIYINISLSDIPYLSISPFFSIAKGDHVYFSLNKEFTSDEMNIHMSPYVKLLIIIFAIMMVILSGFGLYNLIKQQTVKRWPNNKVYEFKDLSVHDSSVDEGDHLKTSN